MKLRNVVIVGVIGICFILLNKFLFQNSSTGNSVTLLATSSDQSMVIRVPAAHTMTPTTDGPDTPDGTTSHWFYSEPVVLQEDTTITGFSVTMEGADTSILHHVSVVVLEEDVLVCPQHFFENNGAYEIYSASRNTLDSISLPSPYGVSLDAGDTLVVEFMAHPQATPHGTHDSMDMLEPTLVVTMNTDIDRTTPVSFARLRLDDSPCAPPLAHQAFVVPTSSPNTIFTKTSENNESSSEYYFASSTEIVLGGANFWPRKGGQDVSVLLNNVVIETYYAEAGADQNDWNIPLSQKAISIPASSTISIQSTYKNPFSVPVKDASGMYGFYFITE